MVTKYFGEFMTSDLRRLEQLLPQLANSISTDTKIVEIDKDTESYKVSLVIKHGDNGDVIPIRQYDVPMIDFLSLSIGYDKSQDILYFFRRKD